MHNKNEWQKVLMEESSEHIDQVGHLKMIRNFYFKTTYIDIITSQLQKGH